MLFFGQRSDAVFRTELGMLYSMDIRDMSILPAFKAVATKSEPPTGTITTALPTAPKVFSVCQPHTALCPCAALQYSTRIIICHYCAATFHPALASKSICHFCAAIPIQHTLATREEGSSFTWPRGPPQSGIQRRPAHSEVIRATFATCP